MKTLIIYTTKYGTVAKAANILKNNINGDVTLVNLNNEKVPNLDEFDTIILGGSIYIGKIQKALTNYLKTNLTLLLQKRVGLFICAAEPEPLRTQELERAFPMDLYNHATAKEKFGFEFNLDKLKMLDKLILSKFKGVAESISELDVATIEKFAQTMSI